MYKIFIKNLFFLLTYFLLTYKIYLHWANIILLDVGGVGIMGILTFPKLIFNKSYLTISILGKTFKLNIKYSSISSVELIKKDCEVFILLPKTYKNYDNSDIISLAIQKLYYDIAVKELENSLELARHILKFAPTDYKIERLKNSYYKCTKDKKLIINPNIFQFNLEIINTTILQAFCKTKFKENSLAYKKALKNALEKYEIYKSSTTYSAKLNRVS